jgi:hypothetical protein
VSHAVDEGGGNSTVAVRGWVVAVGEVAVGVAVCLDEVSLVVGLDHGGGRNLVRFRTFNKTHGEGEEERRRGERRGEALEIGTAKVTVCVWCGVGLGTQSDDGKPQMVVGDDKSVKNDLNKRIVCLDGMLRADGRGIKTECEDEPWTF